jgi:hypothetical protein
VVDKLKLKQIVEESAKSKDQKLLASTSGSKCTSLRIPKLDDAVLAGTKHSQKCTLVLTEGDSAKTFATTGISALAESDRKLFGSFPLRVGATSALLQAEGLFGRLLCRLQKRKLSILIIFLCSTTGTTG